MWKVILTLDLVECMVWDLVQSSSIDLIIFKVSNNVGRDRSKSVLECYGWFHFVYFRLAKAVVNSERVHWHVLAFDNYWISESVFIFVRFLLTLASVTNI